MFLGRHLLFAAIVSVAFARPAAAMDIRMFDDLAAQDQRDFQEFLVKAAKQIFADEGRSDLAKQVDELFHKKAGGEERPKGTQQFEESLARVRKVIADFPPFPGFRSPTVEASFVETLSLNKIDISHTFFKRLTDATKRFWPKRPLNMQQGRRHIVNAAKFAAFAVVRHAHL